MDMLAALRTFIRVVEIGSFSAVARELDSSQSAVTRQIGQLEEHFKVRLLHRTTRRLSLTDDGGVLLDHARRLLEDADAMEGHLGQQSTSPSGHVRIGLPVSFALLFATRLPVLLQRHPGISVEVVALDQVQDMVEGQLDVAVRVGSNIDSSLITRSLGKFHWLCVAAPDYIARAGEPASPENLASHNCIVRLPSHTHGVWRFGVGADEYAAPITGTLAVNESEVARRAALAGLGIARLDEIHVFDDLNEGRLVQVLADFQSTPAEIHMVYPSRRNLAPRTRVVMEFMAEQCSRRLSASRPG